MLFNNKKAWTTDTGNHMCDSHKTLFSEKNQTWKSIYYTIPLK